MATEEAGEALTDYLKIPEVARRLDVSEPTVRRMVKGGKLPSVFIGGAYRVSEEDLEKYLQAARVEPGDGSGKAQTPPPEPFSLEWARTASDAEFYRRIMMTPEEDTDRLDKLSGELHRFISRPVRRILTERNNKPFRDQGPEPNRDEYDRMKERFDALYAKVNRRRPPFAVITWRGVGPAEVRWLVPEDEREALRPKIEETLKGEDYIEIGPGDPATTERPPERAVALA